MEKSSASGSPLNQSLRAPGAIVLVSCYELGQQPLGLATPAAHLRLAGFQPKLIDIDVDALDEGLIADARIVGISVPMHTALRIGTAVAKRVRTINPHCHITFYGLYAALNATYLLDGIADSCLGAEFEGPLLDLAVSLEHEQDATTPVDVPNTDDEFKRARRSDKHAPDRSDVPDISRYTKLVHKGRHHNVGHIATTRGCKHLCTHCPIPSVYNGRFYALPIESIIVDIRRVVDLGAEHVTFSDPDFLNGPSHALRVARLLHGEYPDLTFDITAKVEHLVSHRAAISELRELGCIFVVSAVESLNEQTLKALKKGHTLSEVLDTIRFFRNIGLTFRPTFVPFTPWDTLDDYLALLRLIEDEVLIDHVEPVQYGIRLLVPPGSLLLGSSAMQPFLDRLNPAEFTYAWRHPDPRMDELQQWLAAWLADPAVPSDPAVNYFAIRHEAERRVGSSLFDRDNRWIERHFPHDRRRPPRLTENWFC